MKHDSKQAGATKRSFLRSRGFLGAVCLLVAVALLLGNIFLPKLSTTEMTVVVAKRDLPQGTVITKDDIATMTISRSIFDRNKQLLHSVEDALGRYIATQGVMEGDFLTTAKISVTLPFRDAYLYDLPQGSYAISVSIDTFAAGLSDKIVSGDIVTIYAIVGEASESNYYARSFLSLQAVEVLAVTRGDGLDSGAGAENDEQKANSATITLLVNAQQAQLLAGLDAHGALHIVLAARDKTTPYAQELLRAQADYFTTLADGEGEEDEHKEGGEYEYIE